MATPTVITDDIGALARELRDRAGSMPGIITVDGINGAGKTRLVRQLCRTGPFRHVAIDDFLLQPKKKLYCDSLDLPGLRTNLGSLSAHGNLRFLVGTLRFCASFN
jgi:hypothetical protein